MASQKSNSGRFLEDFDVGMEIVHATPRTVTQGDASLYKSLFPDRHAVFSSDVFARSCGLREAPLNDLAVFHIVFGKSVPGVSFNAVANLGYASCLFHRPVYAGDTLSAASTVLGVKENSSRRNGIVWVRTKGSNQHGETVLEFARWVMVAKRDVRSPAPDALIPDLPDSVHPADLPAPDGLSFINYDFAASGEPHRLHDYAPGETIDHIDGVTIEEAEHMVATRLWQNTAKVHFDVGSRTDGRRLIYGGHIISLARALSVNGLANAQLMLALNAGSHRNPCHAGDTVSSWSHVLETAESAVPGAGAIRLRTIASKGRFGSDGAEGDVLLDIDYWALMPL